MALRINVETHDCASEIKPHNHVALQNIVETHDCASKKYKKIQGGTYEFHKK